MDINWDKVKKVILNDRWSKAYRPDKDCISKVGRLLPDANIFGYGLEPRLGYWILLVECPRFSDNPYGVIQELTIASLSAYGQPGPKLVSRPSGRWFW